MLNAIGSFFSSTAGHWLTVIAGLFISGLIFHKKPWLAGLVCVVILAAAFALNYIDGWIVAIFAVGCVGLVLSIFGFRKG